MIIIDVIYVQKILEKVLEAKQFIPDFSISNFK